MSLNRKVTVFTTVLAVALVVAIGLISLYAFRQYSTTFATEQVRTSAEIVRLGLTESMINGTIDKRDSFLTRLNDIEGFQSAKLVRSAALDGQFGQSKLAQESVPADALEQEVIATGKPAYELQDRDGETLFRGTIPYIASARGTPNCLQCHQVKEGTVLGAVTIVLSIEPQRHKAIVAVGTVVLLILVFSILLIVAARRLALPVSATAGDVAKAVRLALEGNFKGQIEARTRDEIGNIAHDMNRLLNVLGDGLARIAESVSQLINRKPIPGENQINATIEMVEILTRAAHFKQAIEEDETRHEIYDRLAGVLEHEFFITQFSFYEVDASRNQMLPVIVDGEKTGECRWCNPEIMLRSETCRARRTGHVVDGVASRGICYAFQPPADQQDRMPICIPIMQSGQVGNVLQIVTAEAESALHGMMMPFINVYLREAAPVIESKRLMETLRDANLRDPMTGLNNRRFLEEYADTLLANTQRRKAHLALLMLDLDYFKMVNDTYGHDAGDALLKALAKTLRQCVRASDMVIRYGGEEFLIILQEADSASGVKVAENIRTEVEKLKVSLTNGTILQKTISIGVADFPEDSETFWQAIKFADVALYKAKESGRNQVVRFTQDMWNDKQEY